jgi:hypothetical protein
MVQLIEYRDHDVFAPLSAKPGPIKNGCGSGRDLFENSKRDTGSAKTGVCMHNGAEVKNG